MEKYDKLRSMVVALWLLSAVVAVTASIGGGACKKQEIGEAVAMTKTPSPTLAEMKEHVAAIETPSIYSEACSLTSQSAFTLFALIPPTPEAPGYLTVAAAPVLDDDATEIPEAIAAPAEDPLKMSEVSSDTLLPTVVQVQLRTRLDESSISTTHGSGFFVKKGDRIYLFTALHNLRKLGTATFHILDDQGQDVPIEVSKNIYKTSDASDYAALLVKSVGMRPRLLTIGSPTASDNVIAVGYPGEINKAIVLVKNKGTIENITIYTTAVVRAGQSGGALLNDKGEVVGVITSTSQDPETREPNGSAASPVLPLFERLP